MLRGLRVQCGGLQPQDLEGFMGYSLGVKGLGVEGILGLGSKPIEVQRFGILDLKPRGFTVGALFFLGGSSGYIWV